MVGTSVYDGMYSSVSHEEAKPLKLNNVALFFYATE